MADLEMAQIPAAADADRDPAVAFRREAALLREFLVARQRRR